MRSIVLSSNSRHILVKHLSERRAGLFVPKRWHELLDDISREETGIGATERRLRHVFSEQACLFSWDFSPETITSALMGRGLNFLCWGIPRREIWKNKLAAIVLRRAEHVLVNDTTTQSEIETLSGRASTLIPFYIDVEFFTFKPLSGRASFIFCNGSNDRDPTFLLELANCGFRVVWLVNDPILSTRYKERHPNLILRSNISYQELRELYQTCAVYIMPILRDAHCAGQTTAMEAIACGAPVLISEGRTASIFSDLSSVITVGSNSIEEWKSSLMTIILSSDTNLSMKTMHARELLQNRISRQKLRKILASFLCPQIK